MRDPLRQVPVQFKLALVFLGVCLLAFGVGGTLVSTTAKRALEGEILERLELQTRAYASALDSELRLLVRRGEDFASDGHIRDSVERGEAAGADLRSYLVENKLPLEPAFVDLGIAAPDGELRATATGDVEPALRGVAAQSTGRRESFTTDLLPPAHAGGFPRIAVVTPMTSRDGERSLGHLIAVVHPGIWIVDALRDRTHEERGEIGLLLIDRSGRRLEPGPSLIAAQAAPDSEMVLSGFGLRVESAGSGDDSESKTGRETFARSFPIESNGWTLRVELHSVGALAAVAGLQDRFLLLGALLSLAAFFLVLFPVRFLARPISRLSEAARRIKDGDPAARVEVEGADDLAELGHAFNRMAEALEERTRRLEMGAADLRSERDRLNAVISSMREALVVLDPDGRPVVFNRAGRPLLERLRNDEVPLLSHHICESGREGDQACRQCLFDLEAQPRSCVLDVGGSVYELHVTRLAPDRDGRAGSVMIGRDISDRIAQDERQIHQERLAVLGEVAAVMAHEINNPLAAISMYNQMLRAELGEDSALRENVDVIQRNADTCKRAIRELLDYATGSTPEISALDLRDVLEDVAVFLRPLRERSEVGLALDLGDEDLRVSGDEVQIRQILVNLVVNAIQAIRSTDGGGRVEVAARAEDDHVLVEVTDSGAGIAPDARELIFRPFYTTKARGKGTGLGLPTARRIAEMHGGSLELVESEPGRTRFLLRLRRREVSRTRGRAS